MYCDFKYFPCQILKIEVNINLAFHCGYYSIRMLKINLIEIYGLSCKGMVLNVVHNGFLNGPRQLEYFPRNCNSVKCQQNYRTFQLLPLKFRFMFPTNEAALIYKYPIPIFYDFYPPPDCP